jgi:hypothetical protein
MWPVYTIFDISDLALRLIIANWEFLTNPQIMHNLRKRTSNAEQLNGELTYLNYSC